MARAHHWQLDPDFRTSPSGSTEGSCPASRARKAKHGGVVPLAIDAQPNDIAPCYVFLASRESKFITG